MIVKNGFTVTSMWPFVRFELLLGLISSMIAWVAYDLVGLSWVALPAAVATVLGTAVSILLAVRANTAYQRWWEGSGIWAQLVGASRNLVRVAVAVTNSKHDIDRTVVRAFQHDIARRQVAYFNALRIQLREDPGDRRGLRDVVSADDANVLDADNPALELLGRQSARIFEAYQDGLLAGLDNFQMESALATISTQQALAERLVQQPVPRTYAVFSRYLVHLYTALFPFAVVGTLVGHRWPIVPATAVIAFAFRIIERIGTVVEAPFGNTIQDVPLTAISTQLERDLFHLVGIEDRPVPTAATNGSLW